MAPSNDITEIMKMGFVFNHIEDVEMLERYRPGGFHPVAIGDSFCNGRYQVIHKLGFGGHSTVWLARDTSRQCYAALKICMAEAAKDNEFKVMQLLSTSSMEGKSLFRPVQDRFEITGPNGTHLCLVNDPEMMTLKDAKEPSISGFFQLPVARALAAQAVQAVDHLHRNGVVHGDLHVGNVLLPLPELVGHLTPSQIYQQYGEPWKIPITRLDCEPLSDNVPQEAVMPIWLGKPSEDVKMNEARIILHDFGESYMPSVETRRHSNAPLSYRPPEGHFPNCGEPFSYSTDIWSLGCLIWEILGQCPIFNSFFASADRVLDDHVNLLGKLPPDWWSIWEARDQYWLEDGDTIRFAATRHPDHEVWSWERRLELCIQEGRREKQLELLVEEEKEDFLAMMKTMVVLEPTKRASSGDILKSRWMKRWALPELDGLA
ncbi:hypothetical protein FZEAL_6137 [Fusarium zealandicum]|uniref:non-specific serine/threonine protein kinase n=1 Tax=Fusarium zealandicum TaxID=1053134 RepID=A0A8H4XK60_9HYPO|nr:hypothetical protein FZEAL_6137 [Fusarium zealandicum]